MKTFMLLFCTTVFSFSSSDIFSQYTKIVIDKDRVATINEIFDILREQTQYTFIYQEDIFKDMPKVQLKKGTIMANKLLKESLNNKYFNIKFTKENKIIVIGQPKNVVEDQQVHITGKVSDTNGQPLPGVNILVKGTANGTQTDFDGRFVLNVSDKNAVLVISYIGFTTKEITVGSQTSFSVILNEDTANLNEVVVTALGIKREKKAITYSAQNVDVNEVAEARSLNVINSLSGKVAGLNFSTTSNGVGSSSRVVLRGNRSLTGNNQPLYVIDGVPISNSVGSPGSDTGGFTDSDGISNLNPEDIASISVLKGPSAAALYGSRASNGVIIITTKSGKGVSKTEFSVSSNFIASSAYNYFSDVQNQYGQGNGGVYKTNSRSSWGAKLDGANVAAWQLDHNPDYSGPATYAYTAQPNNIKDFFQTGYSLANSFAATISKEKVQGYFSYTNTTSEGIVQSNKLNRHNFNVRLTGDLTSKLTFDVKANYINQIIDNTLRTGEESVGYAVYLLPRNLPYSQYKDFEYIDAAGQLQYNFIDRDAVGAAGGNPFWFAQRNDAHKDERNRFIGFASLKYNFTDALSLQVRTGLDQIANNSIAKNYATVAFNQDKGGYSKSFGVSRELNADFLLSYNKDFGDFSLNFNAGGNHLLQSSSSLNAGGILSKRNFFALANVQTIEGSSAYSEKQMNSLYTSAQLGYKGYLFLDATARNDWSSTLPSNNRSFFYPSVGLSGVISEMIELPEVFSFAKVRGSYAQVGNDTAPYQLSPDLIFNGANGGIVTASPILKNPNLKPEISSSLEFGSDVRFFKNRLGLDFTWYKTNTKDQIFTINATPSSGYSAKVINGGEVENKGVELVLSATPIKTADFIWDITANYASYKSKIVSIKDDRQELIFGDGRLVRSKITVGGEYGDLYIKGFNRTADGQILVGSNGIPEYTKSFDVRAGNFNPDWTGGLKNNFKYKDFSLSFLVDFRIGGEVVSYTQARQAGLGISKLTLAGREGGLVVDGVVATRDSSGNIISTTPNTTQVSPEAYWSSVASRDPRSAEDFVYDATNIRLREVVFGYSMPKRTLEKTPFSGVNFSLVGRNLFFLVNKAKFFDPEQGVGIGNLQGVESFNLPTTRDFGINVKLQF